MRLSFIQIVLLVSALGNVHAIEGYAQPALDKKVSLNIRNQEVESVFREIEQRTNIRFVFSRSLIRADRKVSITAKNQALYKVLDEVLAPLELKYRASENLVIISRMDRKDEEQINSAEAIPEQTITDRTVRGIITDEKGVGLPGVNVVLKGTQRGTISDANGSFQLLVPEGDNTLLFSFVGYVTREIVLGNNTTVEAVLQVDEKALNEVVVVGYGTQRKSQLTGAISSVTAEEIRAVPVTSADQALQGRAAGVDVITSSHAPGATATIRVRGVSSIQASNDPLFVVDGIPISGGLNDINPDIIESMEVLKDASATAIYGARGSGGVILITTKRGKAGKTRITYDTYVGISQLANKVRVLNAEEWVKYKSDAYNTTQLDKLLDPIELVNYQAGKQTDWQELVLRKGLQQSHNIGVLGGNEKTHFSVNANYIQQKGIVKKSDFTRGSLQINLDHQVSKRVKIGTSTLISYAHENVIDHAKLLGQASKISPLGNAYNEDGSLRLWPTSEALLGNPLTDMENDKIRRARIRVFSSIYAEAELMKGLKYRMNFGPDMSFANSGRMIGSYTTARQEAPNIASNTKTDTKAYTLENLLIYNTTFREVHRLEATVLHSVQQQTMENLGVEVMGTPSEQMLWHDLSSGQIRGFDTDRQDWSILSYMARVNYGFKDRYLLTMTARRDGSSRFGKDRKYGFFPSVALAWRMVEEPFLRNLKVISDLKLRTSYGAIGNTALNPYQSMGSLTRKSYLFGSEVGVGFEPSALPNFDLMWESSYQSNIGLDFGLFNNRIVGTLELYRINTHDLLLNRALPPHSGFTKILANIGSTRNTGFEFNITTLNLETAAGFKWTTSLNGAINKNEITNLYGDGKDDVGNSWFIGHPINVFYNLQFDGIWQEDEADEAKSYGRAPGRVKVKDLNNDGKINAEDRKIIGSAIPKWTGGITNNFSFNRFDLSVFINTRQRFMINSDVYGVDNLEARFNIPKFVNYYMPDNPSNDYPQPVTPGMGNPELSILRLRDASFVRVRNVSLGYNFGAHIMKSIGMQSLRLYASAQNPFRFTKFQGWDPESSNNMDSYPSTRLFLLGINASF